MSASDDPGLFDPETASFLTGLASDPVGTMRPYVRQIVAVWIVGSFITAGEEIVDAVLAVFDSFQFVVISVTTTVGNAGSALGSAVLAAAMEVNASVVQSAQAAGPVAPFIQIAFYVAVVVLLVRIIPPLIAALSDAAAAVPIVGPLVDAIVTFVTRFGGDS